MGFHRTFVPETSRNKGVILIATRGFYGFEDSLRSQSSNKDSTLHSV